MADERSWRRAVPLPRHRHAARRSPRLLRLPPSHDAEHRRARSRWPPVRERVCVRRALPTQSHGVDHGCVRHPQRCREPRRRGGGSAVARRAATLHDEVGRRFVGRHLLRGRLAHRVAVELSVPAFGDVVEQRIHGGHEPRARLRRRARRRSASRRARLVGSSWPRRSVVLPRAPVGSAHAVQHSRRLREPVRIRRRTRVAHRGGPRRATGSSPARTPRRNRGGSGPTNGALPRRASRGTRRRSTR